MAIRFDASGDRLNRTTSLPSSTGGLTVMGWFKLSSDRNTYSSFIQVDGASGSKWILSTDADGTTLSIFYPPGGAVTGSALTVGTWYHLAVTKTAGTTAPLVYVNGALDITFTSSVADFTPTDLIIGNSDDPGVTEWLDGCVTSFKVYTRVLTAAEIQQEMRYVYPVSFANFFECHPFIAHGSTGDIGPSALTFTTSGTLATESGPGILLRPPHSRGSWVTSAAVGGLTQSLSFTTDDVAATIAQVLGHVQTISPTTADVSVTIADVLGHTETLGFTTDDVSVTVAEVLGHTEALGFTTDDVSVTIAQTQSSGNTQAISFTTDDIAAATLAQVAGHTETIACTTDDVVVSIYQESSAVPEAPPAAESYWQRSGAGKKRKRSRTLEDEHEERRKLLRELEEKVQREIEGLPEEVREAVLEAAAEQINEGVAEEEYTDHLTGVLESHHIEFNLAFLPILARVRNALLSKAIAEVQQRIADQQQKVAAEIAAKAEADRIAAILAQIAIEAKQRRLDAIDIAEIQEILMLEDWLEAA